MEPFWYFITRAASTLIPLLLIAYGAGLWTGWIKWHNWKREYHAVENDYHKLHDIHDVARATIPELEQRRETLTGEIQGLENLLGQYRDANEKFEAESRQLNQTLRATKRNYEALEDIWRVKLAAAELRIRELESMGVPPLDGQVTGLRPTPVSGITLPAQPGDSLQEIQEDADGHRLIPFPTGTPAAPPQSAEGEALLATPVLSAAMAAPAAAAPSGKSGRKTKGRRAV